MQQGEVASCAGVAAGLGQAATQLAIVASVAVTTARDVAEGSHLRPSLLQAISYASGAAPGTHQR